MVRSPYSTAVSVARYTDPRIATTSPSSTVPPNCQRSTSWTANLASAGRLLRPMHWNGENSSKSSRFTCNTFNRWLPYLAVRSTRLDNSDTWDSNYHCFIRDSGVVNHLSRMSTTSTKCWIRITYIKQIPRLYDWTILIPLSRIYELSSK